ncbi:MAG: Ldh family oxidoreductase [Planctomycetaceae bacterium]|nr:Ldh family oxidoreductase [Planctomycetaceae bacterium]
MTNSDCTKLRTFLTSILVNKGMYAFEAELAAERLLDADRLKKCTEGCASLPRHVNAMDTGDIDPRAISIQVSNTPAISFVDANEGLGHVAATKGMDLAIERAKELGLAIVVVSNSQALGSPLVYARLAALKGMIGLCVTSTSGVSHVEAFESDQAIFGRQPFAYALPYQGNTIGFEFAFEAEHDNEILIPAELSGPFGLLHAVLTCGLTGQKMPVEKKRGPSLERTEHFLMVINPASFAGSDTLEKKLSDLGAHIEDNGRALDSHETGIETDIKLTPETIEALKELGTKLKIEWPFD